MSKVEQDIFKQADREYLFGGHNMEVRTFTKRARIMAVQMTRPFIVYTDRGPMTGVAGDWLVTNHSEDDPGSDLWSISDERMQSTYDEQNPYEETV